MNLVGTTRLDRDDSGAEITGIIGPLQLQASMLDTSLIKAQVGPVRVDHGTLTAQYGPGVHAWRDQGNYGFWVLWGPDRWQIKEVLAVSYSPGTNTAFVGNGARSRIPTPVPSACSFDSLTNRRKITVATNASPAATWNMAGSP